MKHLTTKEVCARLNIDRGTLARYEERGYIRSWQLGQATSPKRWPLEEVKRFESSWKEKKLNKNKMK